MNIKGQFKLCDFGSCSKEVFVFVLYNQLILIIQIINNINKDNRPDIEEYIEKTTTPFYRSPEQLDLYSGYEIGNKVDIFAMGVLVFMLCFKKPPFQTRLSSINTQYFIPV